MTKLIFPIIFLITFSVSGQKIHRNIFMAIEKPDSVEYLLVSCPHHFPDTYPCDTIPKSISSLVNLKSFNGPESRFSKLPSTFNQLKNLEHFAISENMNFKSDELCKLVGLPNLKSLDLFSMNFTEIPDCISEIKSLEEIYISHLFDINLGDVFKVLSKLPNLTTLSFDISQDSIIPKSLNNLKNLKYLYLDYNKNLKIDELLTSTNKLSLKGLSLNSCNIEYLPNSFNEIGSLHALSINDNILDSIPREIFNMKELMFLSIAQNNGYSSEFKLTASISKLKNLKHFNLSYTKIGKLPPELEQLEELEYLNIYRCNISNLVKVIPNIPNLKVLNIDSASYTEEVKYLKQLLPNLKIESKNIGQLEYYSVLEAYKKFNGNK